MAADCLFCKIIAGQIPSNKVYEDDRAFAFRDLNPQAPTHILVVPRKHIPTLNDLTPDDAPLIGHLHLVAASLARQEGHADSGWRAVFNVNAGAGQTVFHIHLHLVAGRPFKWPPG